MTSSGIRPALTPEEWADLSVGGEVPRPFGAGSEFAGARIDDRGRVVVVDSSEAITVAPGRRHALAALALHGQPFGFHRDHLSILRHAISVARRVDTTGLAGDLEGIAARIAALLPPQEG